MSTSRTQTVILIPSYEPDDRLYAYVQHLMEQGFRQIVVVDDGSSAPTQPIFAMLEQVEGCTVLHHDVNHGKGTALKTGYAYIADHFPDCLGVITADADGQHTVEDCCRLSEKLSSGKKALYLGTRDFSQKDVPFKSRLGNRLTSNVFRLLYGQWLEDTQTGLRAFRREELPFMLSVAGERYEYEMKVLMACAQENIPMESVTIQTIYENNNEGSHFHPLRDSYRIYKVILGSFVKFMGASILSYLLDNGIFYLLENFVFVAGAAGLLPAQHAICTLIARLVSAPCNFLLNRRFVFEQKGNKNAFLRYVILAVGMLLISALGVQSLMDVLHVPQTLAVLVKMAVDLILYFASYRIQSKWVFTSKR